MLSALLLLLLCRVTEVTGDGYKLELSFGRLEEKGSPMDYLFQFGYISYNCPPSTCKLSKEKQKEVVKNYQDFANLEQTGELDDATIKQMKVPRCGLWDNKFPGFKETRKGKGKGLERYRRYNPQGTRWEKVFKKKPLTWRYQKPNHDTEGITKDLPRDDVIRIIKKAMVTWTKHTNIEFVEDYNNEPDIWVYFQGGSHGDSFPFDGPGRTLAHAFFPLSNRGLAGDLHFDDDETFTEKTTAGRNLLWIAIHELGHSLGLGHSNVREAIMYPYYTGYQGDNLELNEDDIFGIQSIYGGKIRTTAPATAATTTEKTTEPTTTTTEATTTTTTVKPRTIKPRIMVPPGPDAKCPPKRIDALINAYGEIGMFADGHLATYDVYNGGLKRFNTEQHEVLRRFKEIKIDSMVRLRLPNDREDSIVVFIGREYHVFDLRLTKHIGTFNINGRGSYQSPLNIKFPYSIKKIEAALNWQRNGKIYLFYRFGRTGYYRRFNLKTNSFDRDRFGRVSWLTGRKWRLPNIGPDAAVSTPEYGTYFVIKDRVYKYDDKRVRAERGFPKKVNQFFKCDTREEMP